MLPSLSKILKKVMFDQLLAYLSNNNLLCIDQFGFRPGHSTELAALRLVDHLIAQMDRYTGYYRCVCVQICKQQPFNILMQFL